MESFQFCQHFTVFPAYVFTWLSQLFSLLRIPNFLSITNYSQDKARASFYWFLMSVFWVTTLCDQFWTYCWLGCRYSSLTSVYEALSSRPSTAKYFLKKKNKKEIFHFLLKSTKPLYAHKKTKLVESELIIIIIYLPMICGFTTWYRIFLKGEEFEVFLSLNLSLYISYFECGKYLSNISSSIALQ